MTPYVLSGGTANTLGAHHDGEGVNFAVFSENATRVELCLFSADGSTEQARIALPERTGPVWHGYLSDLPVGTLYGYRVHGSYAPELGHRFNPNKLLLDPYTRELKGEWGNHPATLGYDDSSSAQDLSFDARDSAPYVPKSVVSDPSLFAGMAAGLHKKSSKDLIYEAHPKGATMINYKVPEAVRGTYEAFGSDAMLEHFKTLGVQAVELLPVHSFVDDKFLVERGLTNYWGYNSIGFFALEPRYLGPDGLKGFRQMVDSLHADGIEVILDVVFNHTAEGDQRGPTLSFRGLDNASYYRLTAGQARYYVNDTGCGNTLKVSHPYVLRMVLDSLRFWVENMGIDGFRFDLATTLGREDHGFEPHGGFFDALRQDPVLSQVRMIAEPWDIGPGGYQLGGFPHEFLEWNDSYRDTVRRYWRGDAHSAQELGARLLGSADTFDQRGRRSDASVNFLASHDGFTLADTTRYSRRHNEANTENNRDGHHSNFSDNAGVEGDSDDAEVRDIRARRQRNMLATLFLSQGTPMLLAGDEFANSQQGNNNAYCQDNDIGWLNWDQADTGLQSFVASLSAFRQDHVCLRQSRFLHGAARPNDGLPDAVWMDFHGQALEWRDPRLANLCLLLRCSAEMPDYAPDGDAVFIVFNRKDVVGQVTLPVPRDGHQWVRCIDTDQTLQDGICTLEQAHTKVASQSVTAFVQKHVGSAT
ncbi:glycogen debranching protein GlgX [Pelagimonas varians]|uniref:Glycogen debranching enzyme n=1 Tax=Pelagimonas varians TaxID=696760 RepID=A0A238KWT7_9RHOB|nr:glycogen debranching protein GlgX [Pelagimonas varians]PYG27978.1 glycogen operon protein [Pelagimonas varians]SMX47158.1 Glycogen debranching enzyme [Pelagimonas varians]